MKSWNLDKRSNAHHRLSELSSDVLLSHKWFSCCGAWPGRSDANEKKTEAHLGSESQTRGRSPVLCILIHLPGDCGAGYVKTIALHPCTHAGLLTVHVYRKSCKKYSEEMWTPLSFYWKRDQYYILVFLNTLTTWQVLPLNVFPWNNGSHVDSFGTIIDI